MTTITKPVATITKQATPKPVAGSADAIVQAAVGQLKAGSKLSEQVRALLKSSPSVIKATLMQVFAELESALPKGQSDAWGQVANSVATNARIQWRDSPNPTKPRIFYIALSRADRTARVEILPHDATDSEVRAALQHDQRALNKALPEKPAPEKPAPKAAPVTVPVSVGAPDSHEPKSDALAQARELWHGMKIADLHTLRDQLSALITEREEKALKLAEAKAKKPTAKAKIKPSQAAQQAKAAQIAYAKAV